MYSHNRCSANIQGEMLTGVTGNILPDTDGCRRCRRRRIEDMDHTVTIDQAEIVKQSPFAVDRLGPDTGPARPHITTPEFWDQALQIADKQAFTE
jgi:hypothetical protein